MKDWIEDVLGERRSFSRLWVAVGSLFALSMVIGFIFVTPKQTALDGIAWLGTTLRLPQGYADWIASRQTWLSEHHVAASKILGVLLGLGIFALIIYGGYSGEKPSGPAGATVFVLWGIAQEVGVTVWWLVGPFVLAIVLSLMWLMGEYKSKYGGLEDFVERFPLALKELRDRCLLAVFELPAVVFAPLIMLFEIFYKPQPESERD